MKMDYRVYLLYFQCLTLLLITNQTFAFQRDGQGSMDVRSEYARYSEPDDQSPASNLLRGTIVRAPTSTQTIFQGLQVIYSLTYRVLHQLNTTNYRLGMIEQSIKERPGSESVIFNFDSCPSDESDDVEEYHIWLRQILSDSSSARNVLRNYFVDRSLTKPLSKIQSPALNPWLRLPPSRFRQPPMDPKPIAPFWLSRKNDFPRSLDKVGKLLQRQLPPDDLPLPIPVPFPERQLPPDDLPLPIPVPFPERQLPPDDLPLPIPVPFPERQLPPDDLPLPIPVPFPERQLPPEDLPIPIPFPKRQLPPDDLPLPIPVPFPERQLPPDDLPLPIPVPFPERQLPPDDLPLPIPVPFPERQLPPDDLPLPIPVPFPKRQLPPEHLPFPSPIPPPEWQLPPGELPLPIPVPFPKWQLSPDDLPRPIPPPEWQLPPGELPLPIPVPFPKLQLSPDDLPLPRPIPPPEWQLPPGELPLPIPVPFPERQLPPEDLPMPIPFSKRQPRSDPRLFVPSGTNRLRPSKVQRPGLQGKFYASYPSEIERRSWQQGRRGGMRQLFENDKDPPPDNPYANQPPPENIYHNTPYVPYPTNQSNTRSQGGLNMDHIPRAILGR